MKHTLLAALVCSLFLSTAQAAPCPCDTAKSVVVRAHPRRLKHESKTCSFIDQVKEGFGLTAGWRWDQECPTCPKTCTKPETPKGHHDPFFVGAELRLPLAERLTAFGNYDRDWAEGNRWNARAGISFRPLARR